MIKIGQLIKIQTEISAIRHIVEEREYEVMAIVDNAICLRDTMKSLSDLLAWFDKSYIEKLANPPTGNDTRE